MSAAAGDLPLAVYGTLLSGLRNHHLLAGCEPLGTVTLTGRLHVVGLRTARPYPYPALVLADAADAAAPAGGPAEPAPGPVPAELYRVGDPSTWAALDDLEAYDPLDPDGSEYRRVPALAHAERAARDVQVYAYAGDAAALGPVVPGGDWRAWTRLQVRP